MNEFHFEISDAVPAYRWFVLTGVKNPSLDVARGTIVVGNIGIFADFLGVLPFPQFHSINALHFSIPLSLHIHLFHVIFHLIHDLEQ